MSQLTKAFLPRSRGAEGMGSQSCPYPVPRCGESSGGMGEQPNELGKVQMYLPSATDCHGWEKKLFSSAFHAREIISKLIIY